MKRKRTIVEAESASGSGTEDAFSGQQGFGGEIDISSTLVAVNEKIEEDDEEFIRKTMESQHAKEGTRIIKNFKGKSKLTTGEVGGGSFQSMGLHPSLLRSLTMRGYRIPTPIQRLAIPVLLSSPPRDLVGMARTGSGKTLAYMVPLVQRLGGRHDVTFGARALILVPARELALQVLKVGKELARGWAKMGGDHAGDVNSDEESSKPQNVKGHALRWGLVVGGESLDEQFEMISGNPDVIIATPGRLLHLIVEMNLDLRSVQYVVFDEADRLFEMGFATAMNEILHRLPATRQTLLFSATLPKSLVDFAKAGLQNPKLVRLDAESKISTDLRMAFFSVLQVEKEAALLFLLRDVIGVPYGNPTPSDGDAPKNAPEKGNDHHAARHQALIFVATKHHVEYLSSVLRATGYSVSHIYGALDQTARTLQMNQFRRALTNILVVTDVAARGIDIPVLENVINYDFPHGARVFVHRVGRTARAGRKGWAWSFVTHSELPHLLDLQLFLARPIKTEVPVGAGEASFTESLILGTFDREILDQESEYIKALDESNTSLEALRGVMRKGHGLYERSQGKASQASYKRAKEMVKQGIWALAGSLGDGTDPHPVFSIKSKSVSHDAKEHDRRTALLRVVSSFRPSETVFEVGMRGKTPGAMLMKDRRKSLAKAIGKDHVDTSTTEFVGANLSKGLPIQVEAANEEEIEAVFETSRKGQRMQTGDFRDSDFYMAYEQKDVNTERGYSLRDGASFAEQAQGSSFDLTTDEAVAERRRRDSQLNWDKKRKKFVKGDGIGADNVKMIRTESGARLPSTYRSGRYDEWKVRSRVNLPKVGEAELPQRIQRQPGAGGRRFRHSKITAPKPLDKLANSYERKLRQGQKQDVGDRGNQPSPEKLTSSKKGGSRYGSKPISKVKNELKSAAHIRKARDLAQKRRAKNARPGKGRVKGKRR